MTSPRKAAAILGRLGGKAKSEAKAAASRKNGAKGGSPGKPCKCGHGKSRHKWQREGSRAGCKDCPCVAYRETR